MSAIAHLLLDPVVLIPLRRNSPRRLTGLIHERNQFTHELLRDLGVEGLTSMTIMLSAPPGMPDAVAAVESVTEEVTQTPVLIAEQEVVFSTAAAVRVRPATTRRELIAVLRGVFVDSTANAAMPSLTSELARREKAIPGAARILKANYALMIGTPAQKRLDQKLAWDGRLVT